MQQIKIGTRAEGRVETGAVQFFYDDKPDWPGLFIRGDNALHLAMQVQHLFDNILTEDQKSNYNMLLYLSELKSLVRTIQEEVLM